MDVVVPDDQLSLAIGRRAMFALRRSCLSWAIDILTERPQSSAVRKVPASLIGFIEALDVDDVLAHLLVTEGFNSIEEVAWVDVAEPSAIEGLDDEVASELQQRAQFLSGRGIGG